jgi:hypothetical protein
MDMDKTSFIPKTVSRPVYKQKGLGFAIIFSVAMLVFSLLSFGGVFLYKGSIEQNVSNLSVSLKRAQAAFEPAFISELEGLSSKIKSAKVILKKHKSLLGVFDILEELTLKSVRFSSFDYNAEQPEIILKGEAKSYRSLASQADVFRKNNNIERIEFSDISLKDGGNIGFQIKIIFNKNFFNYLPPVGLAE